MPDETHLIRRITRALPSVIGRDGRSAGVALGIGDDAMILRGGGGKDWVLTVDAFIEGVHFWPDKHPPDSVGYKALARATSDLAAMGAHPRLFLLTLALPKSHTGAWLDAFLAGMGKAARTLGLKLVGGDTTQASAVSISLTVLGQVARGHAVGRSGARPGDLIFVSGQLGCAQLGLELVRHGLARDPRMKRALQAHFYPHIRLELGAWLASHRVASAMMDISDGLSMDLPRLCTASGVAARIHSDRIPRVVIPAAVAKRLRKPIADPLEMALHGGDDYELLFTVPKRLVSQLRKTSGFQGFAEIGEIRRGRGVSLVVENGQRCPLVPLGWDSFREKRSSR